MLVGEEYLAEDLGWDATGGREGVAAGTDLAQCAKDGSHLCINEVKRCRVCEGGGRDLLEDVVDEGNARLDSIGPVLGGSEARNVCGRDKSFDPRSGAGFLEHIRNSHYIVLCRRWVVHLEETSWRMALPTRGVAGSHSDRRAGDTCWPVDTDTDGPRHQGK